MKHSVTGAWILWLWVEAAPVSWPCNCEKHDFLIHVFWLASRLGLDYEALGNENLNFFLFTFGFHQGLGLTMKLSVTRTWILGLWVEAAPGSWPYECEMFDFFFQFFFGVHQGVGLIMKHSVTGAWILWILVEAACVNKPCKCEKHDFLIHVFWLASRLGPDYEVSVTRAWIFSFFSWLAIRLGPDYEALSKGSLNFFISFLACIKAWAWLWSSR
jgi:hypothetical protein